MSPGDAGSALRSERRALSDRVFDLVRPLVRRRGPIAVGAIASTIAGAILLATFTRRTGSGIFEGAPIIAITSVVLLLFGIVLGALWLGAELAEERDEDRRRRSSPVSDTEPEGNGETHGIHRLALALAILVGASAGVTMGQMGDLLLGFHRPGAASFDQAALQGPANPLDRKHEIEEALQGWSRFARPGLHEEPEGVIVEPPEVPAFADDRNAPITVLAWFFGLDSGLFVPAYFAVFGLLLLSATRALHDHRGRIRVMKRDPEAYHPMIRWTAIALIITAFTDQLENWLALTTSASAWFAGDPEIASMTVGGLPAVILGIATLIKTFFFGVTVLSLVLIGLFLIRNGGPTTVPWSGTRGAWQSLLAVRVQVIALVFFTALMSFRIQAADTFVRWADDWWVAVIASILVIGLGVGIWHTGRWSVRLATEPARSGSRSLAWWLFGLALLLLFLFGVAAGWAVSWGLAVPFVIAGVVALLGIGARKIDPVEPIRPGIGADTLPRLLGAGVLALFGLAVLKASTGQLIYAWIRGLGLFELVILTGIGLVFVFGSVGLFWVFSRVASADERDIRAPRDASVRAARSRWLPSLALLVCIVVWMVVVLLVDADVFSLASSIGMAGVMAVFTILLVYSLSSLVAVSTSLSTVPAPAFRAAGFRRTPVLSLILLWAVLVSLLPLSFPRAPVNLPQREGHQLSGKRLDVEFGDWVVDNCLSGAPTDTIGGREMPVAPLILVSSSGGGVRAAVWTSFVMDEMFGYADAAPCDPLTAPGAEVEDPSRWIFAASGISGGSLGLLNYAAQMTAGPPPPDSARDRIQAHFGDDSLASTLAWMLLVEAPWSLLRFSVDRDRGDVLQESWERQWSPNEPGMRQDFVGLMDRHDEVPLLILNGASAESGCRFNGSVLDANGRERTDAVIGCLEPPGLEGSPTAILPATIDLVDFLCRGQTMSLAKAALLSARFPLVSPVAELQQCVDLSPRAGVDPSDPDPTTFVVDGGYLEGSGTATVVDLWASLAPLVTEHNLSPTATACIVPFFFQIDNSYLEPAGPGDTHAPPPLIVLQELSARSQNRNGYSNSSRQAAQIAFGGPFRLGGVEIMGPDGVEITDRYVRFSPVAHPGATAPLGWTLSEVAFQDLFDQLGKNQPSIDEFATWFRGLTCTVSPRT